jgi:hypothetical protein
MSDLEAKLEAAKRQQDKGKVIEEIEEAGGIEEERQDTLYAKSAEMIAQKLFNPQNQDEKTLLSNIPRQILTNINMMQGIEYGTRAMIEGEKIEIIGKTGKEYVHIYDKTTGKVKKKMTYNAYRRTRIYADFMTGFNNIVLQLPAVEGQRASQGIDAIGSLTNSERMLLEAQSQNSQGALKKLFKKVF